MKDKSLTIGLMTALPGQRRSPGGRKPAREAPPTEHMPARYEDDIYTWALQQGDLLRQGRFDQLDTAKLIDEVEDVARREVKALESDLRVVMLHLLKWDHQPERRSRSWALTVREHRDRIRDLLTDSPGLKNELSNAVRRGYRGGRVKAAEETDLPIGAFPDQCPYAWDDIMERVVEHGDG